MWPFLFSPPRYLGLFIFSFWKLYIYERVVTFPKQEYWISDSFLTTDWIVVKINSMWANCLIKKVQTKEKFQTQLFKTQFKNEKELIVKNGARLSSRLLWLLRADSQVVTGHLYTGCRVLVLLRVPRAALHLHGSRWRGSRRHSSTRRAVPFLLSNVSMVRTVLTFTLKGSWVGFQRHRILLKMLASDILKLLVAQDLDILLANWSKIFPKHYSFQFLTGLTTKL